MDKKVQQKDKATGVPEALNAIDAEIAARRYGAALDLAYQAVHEFPDTRPLDLKLGFLLETCKEWQKSLNVLRHVHELTQKGGGKTEVGVLIAIAHCLLRLNNLKEGRKLLDDLNAAAPDIPQVLTLFAFCERKEGKLEQAEALARRALAKEPDDRQVIHELAHILLDRDQKDEALKLLERNIRRKDLYGDSIDLWLKTLDDLNRNRHAQDTLEELMKIHPDVVEFTFGYAVLANRAGELSLARPAYEKSMELSPNNPRIIYELGVLERSAGNLDRSQDLIGQALELKPDNPAALRTYCSDLKVTYGDENFKRLNFVAAKLADFSPLEQIHMHYALAKAFEDVSELDTAFRHYAVGGEKKRKMETYSDRESAKMTSLIPKIITRQRLAETENQKGYDSDVPVFILGMPRSGTSLMEQILSAHPDIFGAGELKVLTGVLENIPVAQNRLHMAEKDPVFPQEQNATWEDRGRYYVDRLLKIAGKPYKRIVDKMPGNYNFVGLIHAILPNAKIIHSRRHPIETCLSCYRIHFAEGHQWTYNLRELGKFYKRYWNLMKYWREEFPGVMYEVRYEENVADVEGQARKLIDHLGLEWNDNCLNFYNIDRPVLTASVTQVRKPIYKTSTNRWRKYEKYLGPLLDELGDVVEEYEREIAHLIEQPKEGGAKSA
jgi:tetratricopeptide (TPR) repeat protein